MSELEHNAFIEHCKSSEIYKVVYMRKGMLDDEPQGEIAWEDWERSHCDESSKTFIKNGKIYYVYETKEVKVIGYNNGKENKWGY
tara:strand:+ start:247 stop:501 length:255 start_codon:yes stop_codon:yes gene_type:complete